MKGALNWIAASVSIVCGALCSLGFAAAYVLRVEGNPVWARTLCIVTPICVGLGITSILAFLVAILEPMKKKKEEEAKCFVDGTQSQVIN